jgi:hypothetical protein
MKLFANETMLAELERREQQRVDLEQLLSDETARLRGKQAAHTDVDTMNTNPRTRKPSGTPRGRTYRDMDDRTIAGSEALSSPENHAIVARVIEESLGSLERVISERDRIEALKEEEADRISAVKVGKAKRQRMTTAVLKTDGRSHIVNKRPTLMDRLLKAGKIEPDVHASTEKFCELYATHLKASKVTSRYVQGISIPAFTGRDLSAYERIGGYLYTVVATQRIPDIGFSTFLQIVNEGMGYHHDLHRTLEEIGQLLYGYKHSQRSPAGVATVVLICGIIHKFMTSRECRMELDKILSEGHQKNISAAA